MNAIKLHIKLEPDSLTKNPEIIPFIGKNVEIIVIEESPDTDNKKSIQQKKVSRKNDPFFRFLTDPENFRNDKDNLTDVSENHDKYIY